jgi:hypothetical protein
MAAIGEVIEKHMIDIGFITPRDQTLVPEGGARSQWRRKERQHASARVQFGSLRCMEGWDTMPVADSRCR